MPHPLIDFSKTQSLKAKLLSVGDTKVLDGVGVDCFLNN